MRASGQTVNDMDLEPTPTKLARSTREVGTKVISMEQPQLLRMEKLLSKHTSITNFKAL